MALESVKEGVVIDAVGFWAGACRVVGSWVLRRLAEVGEPNSTSANSSSGITSYTVATDPSPAWVTYTAASSSPSIHDERSLPCWNSILTTPVGAR